MLELIIAAPLHDPTWWNPVPFTWRRLAIGGAVMLALTIGAIIWLVVMRDEPDMDNSEQVKRATERDRERARQTQRMLDADSGREDAPRGHMR